jgi:uncharacterized protein (DUF488 family)
VGITVGKPQWPLAYTPVYLLELAPWGLLGIDDDGEFTRRYLERLDRVGVDRIARQLDAISRDHEGRGLVLLCYEPAGEFCHRRVFARWWEEQTGEVIPELSALQEQLPVV